MAKAAAGAAAAGPGRRPARDALRRADGSTAEVEGTATAVTYRGRPAVQFLLREVARRPAGRAPATSTATRSPASPAPSSLPDRLSVAISQAYRHRARVGVVHVDLDGFARARRALGRPARRPPAARRGPPPARTACARATPPRGSRQDAFVLVLPGLHHGEDATRIGEKVLRALRKPFPLDRRRRPASPPASGSRSSRRTARTRRLSSPRPSSPRAARTRRAATASSRALPRRVEDGCDALELEAGLRAALAGGSMALNGTPPPAGVLHYQPIFALGPARSSASRRSCAGSTRSSGLVFPQTSSRSPTSPGLILAIGPWILRTAAVQVREWQRRQRALRLAVNLSPPELMKKTLPDEVKAALEETGFPPRQLQLEVPEGHVVSDLPRSLDMLHRLKALGVSLVLDRFAVRYSSLGRLAELPLDGVKLDLAFLRGPSSNPEDVSLLTAVTAVARGLKLRVCAQGVETAAQLASARAAGLRRGAGLPPRPPGAAGDARRPARGPRREARRRGGAPMSFGGRLETLDLVGPAADAVGRRRERAAHPHAPRPPRRAGAAQRPRRLRLGRRRRGDARRPAAAREARRARRS